MTRSFIMPTPDASTPQRRAQLCFVIPVFNEEENLAPLTEEIEAACAAAGCSFEIVFINDGSTDGSAAVLEELGRSRDYVRTIHHSVNCGQSAAMASGFRAARGEVIVTMDSDRQNDPADLPLLLAALREGVDCAAGVRRERHDTWLRRVSSKIANGFRNAVLREKVTDAGCCYRALRRECIAELPVFNGMHRFIPTILRLQGYTVVEVEVSHRPRVAGVAKYGVRNRALRGLRDCFAMRWYGRRVVPGRRVLDRDRGAARTSGAAR